MTSLITSVRVDHRTLFGSRGYLTLVMLSSAAAWALTAIMPTG